MSTVVNILTPAGPSLSAQQQVSAARSYMYPWSAVVSDLRFRTNDTPKTKMNTFHGTLRRLLHPASQAYTRYAATSLGTGVVISVGHRAIGFGGSSPVMNPLEAFLADIAAHEARQRPSEITVIIPLEQQLGWEPVSYTWTYQPTAENTSKKQICFKLESNNLTITGDSSVFRMCFTRRLQATDLAALQREECQLAHHLGLPKIMRSYWQLKSFPVMTMISRFDPLWQFSWQ